MKHIKILLLLLLPIVASSQTNTIWLSGSTVDNTVIARNNFFVNGTGNLGGLLDTVGSVVGLPLGAVRVRPQDSIPYQFNGKTVGRKWVPVGSLGVSGVISVNGLGGAVTITTGNISNTANFITAGQAPVQSVNGNTGVVVVDGTITHIGGDGVYTNVTGLGTGASPYLVSWIGGSNAGNNADSIRHRFVDTAGGMITGSSLFYNLSSNKFVLKPFAYGMTLYGGIPGVDTNLIQPKGGPSTIALPSNTIFMGNGSGVAASVAITGDISSVNTGLLSVVGIRGNNIPSLSTGFLQWTGSAWAFNNSTFLTANQSITFTAAGDIGGTASGTTALSPTLTLNTITTATSCTYCSFTKDVKGRVTVSSSNTPVTSVSAGTFMSFSTITNTGAVNADTTASTGFSSYYLRRKDSTLYSTAYQNSLKQNIISGTGILKLTGTTTSFISGPSTSFVKADGSVDASTYISGINGLNSGSPDARGIGINGTNLVPQTSDATHPGFESVRHYTFTDSLLRGLYQDTTIVSHQGVGDSIIWGNKDTIYSPRLTDSAGFHHYYKTDGTLVMYASSSGGGSAAGSTGDVQFKNANGLFSTAPSSSFHYDSTNGRLGIGIAAPISTFQIVDLGTSTVRGLTVSQYNTGTNGARVSMDKFRGTVASPTVILTGDALGSYTWRGYDGTNSIEAAKILATSTGTIGTGQIPSIMALQTANSAGTLTTGISIASTQALTFPAYTTNGGLLFTNGSGVVAQGGTPAHTGMRPVWNGTTVNWTDTTALGGGIPASPDSAVQVNNVGAFGANKSFTLGRTTGALFAPNNVVIGQNVFNSANQRAYGDYQIPGGDNGIYALQVVGSDSVNGTAGTRIVNDSSSGSVAIDAYNKNGGGAILHFRSARGNWLHPSGSLAGDVGGGIATRFYMSDTASFNVSPVAIHMVALENQSIGHWGSYIQFFATRVANAGTRGNPLNLYQDSAVFSTASIGVYNPASTPSFITAINGTSDALRLNGNLNIFGNEAHVGSDNGAFTRTSSVQSFKLSQSTSGGFFSIINSGSSSTANTINYGGGSASYQAATNHVWWIGNGVAAPLGGTQVGNIDAQGQWIFTPTKLTYEATYNGAGVVIQDSMPVTPTGAIYGNLFRTIGQGSASQITVGTRVEYIGTYSGSSATVGLSAANNVAGTGTDLKWGNTITLPAANTSATFFTFGTGAGYNIGSWSEAINSTTLNIGSWHKTTKTVNGGNDIALVSQSYNNGTGTTSEVAGYFFLGIDTPSFNNIKSVMVLDNRLQLADIFQARRFGTSVFKIDSIGIITSNKMLTAANTAGFVTKSNDSTLQNLTVANAATLLGVGTDANYTPSTLSATNATAVTLGKAHYTKTGIAYHVFVTGTFSATAPGNVVLTISLPSTATDASGDVVTGYYANNGIAVPVFLSTGGTTTVQVTAAATTIGSTPFQVTIDYY